MGGFGVVWSDVCLSLFFLLFYSVFVLFFYVFGFRDCGYRVFGWCGWFGVS